MGIISFFSKPRVWVATIFLAITLISIIIGKLALAIFLGVLIYQGSKEYVSFTRAKGLNPSLPIILTVDFLLILFATIQSFDRVCKSFVYYDFLGPLNILIDSGCNLVRNQSFLGMVITFGVIITFISMLSRGGKATINDTSATVLGFMYGGWLPMNIILLRNLYKSGIHLFGIHVREGLGYIILIFFIITASDVFAYYFGRAFGKTRLLPAISPNKTVEGSIAGTIGSIIFSVIVGHYIGIGLFHSLIAGLILSIAAQFGDLSESMMKRDAGMKDSGNLLPGHGGVLDRADSYIFTGAVAYYYFSLFVIGVT